MAIQLHHNRKRHNAARQVSMHALRSFDKLPQQIVLPSAQT